MKELRGGDTNWKLKHLGTGDEGKIFMNYVVLLSRKKAGSLELWANVSVENIKEIIDKVFGEGVHEVTAETPWVGLVCSILFTVIVDSLSIETNAHLHNWRNGFCWNTLKPMTGIG